MKHLKLYEEYTDSTMEAGSTQSTGKTTIKPSATGPKPKEQFIREVNFYSASVQQRVVKNGWINLLDFDRDFAEIKGKHNNNHFEVRGFFYPTEMDAFRHGVGVPNSRSTEPKHLHWQFRKGDLGNDGSPTIPNFVLFVEEPNDGFIFGWNEKLNLFLRDRYLQKNSSGVWVKKVASGGFADNSSVDTPDKFA